MLLKRFGKKVSLFNGGYFVYGKTETIHSIGVSLLRNIHTSLSVYEGGPF
jgi:hypothetical protein